MDLLKFAALGLMAALWGCMDPFAPSTPENPSSGATVLATTAQQVPQRVGEALEQKNPDLLGNILGDATVLSAPTLPDQDQVGLRVCVQRLASIDPGSRLTWWNSTPTTTSSGASTSDTIEISMDYRLARQSADRTRLDTLAIQSGSKWTVRRVNPSEWRLLRWQDASASSSFLKLCGSPR
ncbi:MAG TPA: hypothetical protein PKO15_04495 [Fibrobacteria bacterium]|nr:hypothetical protein [Fibrobacteria bacterium]HOX50559.1 hypothetical protein [Fibrobacteria bacterium]